MAVCSGSLLLVGRDAERLNDLARSLTRAGYRIATSAGGRQESGEAFDLVVCLVRAADSVVDVVGLSAGAADVLGLIDGVDPVTGAGSFGCGAASCIPFPVDEQAVLSAVRAAVTRARERHAYDVDRDRLRRLMDQAPVGVFEIEGERPTYVNEYLVRVSKYSADELLAMKLQDLVVPEHARRLLDAISQRLRGAPPGEPSTYRLLAKDGEEREVEIISRRIETSSGVRIEGTARDVTTEARLARLHRVVLELGEVILGEQDVDRILQLVLDTITEYSGFRRAVLSLYDLSVASPIDGGVVKTLCSGLSPEDQRTLLEQDHFSPANRRKAFSDEFRLGPAYYLPHDRVPWEPDLGISGTLSMEGWHVDDFLFIPLRGTAGIIGCISVDDPVDQSAPTLASIEPVAHLASFAALAVEHVYKLNLLRTQNERLHSLSRFGDQIAHLQSTKELCDAAARRVCDDMGYDYCAVWLRDGDVLVLEGVAAGKSFSHGEITARGTRGPLEGEGLSRWVVRYIEPVVVDDVSLDPRHRGSRPSIRSMAAVPILGRKGVRGVLCVESERLAAFTQHDLAALSSLASQLSIALAALARREAVTRIYSLGQRISASTSGDHIVAGALDFLAEQFSYPLASVFLHGKDGRLSVAGLRGPYPERGVGTGWTLPAEKGIVSWVARNRRFALVHDVSSDPRYFEALPGTRSEIAVPLLFADQLVGVLNIESPQLSFFDDEDRVLLEVIANHLATALANLASQESLREQAIRDSLTGLFNRHYFNSIIAPELSRSDRYARPFSVMMIDIDNFRAVNNRFGHLKGDEVLQEMSRLLLDQVRTSDRLIRYGGDEFLIFMPETEESEATLVAARLREQMVHLPRRTGVHEIPLGLSIGIYTRQPREKWSLEAILEEADRRLYADKRARHVEQIDDCRR
jgi:diguanylate cyclase (GGDEF)-like protein/PAS domain S-box-containing protein